MKHFITLSLFLLIFADYTTAQIQSFTGPDSNMGSTLEKVDVHVQPRMATLQAGSEAQFAVVMDIARGWHLNAHKPTLDYLIGVELDVEASNFAMVSDIWYPEPIRVKFEFAQNILDVYEGESVILLKLKTSDNLKSGTHEVKARLRLQACNDKVCLPPADVELSFPVTIGESNVSAGYAELFEKLNNQDATITADSQIASLFSEHGFFWAFLSIFLIGLALNLTPCVYPMISVTVSLFGGQADSSSSSRSTFIHALVYMMGIVAMYSTLGVMAAYTGKLFGSWLQSPWVLAGIGLLIFALSLSMFGFYELQPPAWMLQKLGKTQQAAGYAGHFFSGLLVGVFAAPCIGPPIIALLTFVGTQGSPVFGFFAFFVMALGLGIPYLFLGTFSGLLNNLPKSGEWMIWVKKLFGIVLVGVALFYLALAFASAYSMHMVLATIVIGGIYLGFIERSGNSQSTFRWVKRTAGIGALITGLLLFQNLHKDSVEWMPYDSSLVEQARQNGQPVMMDFYADWCIPCIEMDRITFTDYEVIDQTSSYMRLKVDLTHFDSEEAEQLRKQYDIAGIPTILFLDSEGNEIKEARVVGFIGPEKFLKILEMIK